MARPQNGGFRNDPMEVARNGAGGRLLVPFDRQGRDRADQRSQFDVGLRRREADDEAVEGRQFLLPLEVNHLERRVLRAAGGERKRETGRHRKPSFKAGGVGHGTAALSNAISLQKR